MTTYQFVWNVHYIYLSYCPRVLNGTLTDLPSFTFKYILAWTINYMAPKMGYLLKKKKKGKQAICLKQMVQGRVQISYRKNRDHLQIVSEKV